MEERDDGNHRQPDHGQLDGEGAYRSWADVLERHFLDHGVAGEEARQLATFVLAWFEGALLLARVQRDVSPLYAVSATLAGMVKKAVGK